MMCKNCPGCGQFCNYPACQPGYVPPQPVDSAAQVAAALAWAAAWETRNTVEDA